MRISEAQMEELRAAQRASFIRELAKRARQRHAEKAAELSEEALLAGMDTAVTTAKTFGLKTRGTLRRFSDLVMLFGFGFPANQDWATAALSNESRDPVARLGSVEETAVFVLRGG
jgi:hypothetical protein